MFLGLFCLLAILAVVCFVLATFNLVTRINLVALGLALLALISAIQYGSRVT